MEQVQEPVELESTKIYIRVFPADLWHQLKIRAATERSTLQEQLAKAIQFYLENGR